MRKNLGKWLLVWPPQAYLLFFFLVPALIMLFASFRFPATTAAWRPGCTARTGRPSTTSAWRTTPGSPRAGCTCNCSSNPSATPWSPPWPACSPTLARAPAKWRNLLILLVILPFWSNLLVRVYAWMIILSPSGALTRGINAALDLFGAQPISLMFTPFAVILCMVYVHLPFMIRRSTPTWRNTTRPCWTPPRTSAPVVGNASGG